MWVGRNGGCDKEYVVGGVKGMEDTIPNNLNDLNELVECITIPSFLLPIFPHSMEHIASFTFHSPLFSTHPHPPSLFISPMNPTNTHSHSKLLIVFLLLLHSTRHPNSTHSLRRQFLVLYQVLETLLVLLLHHANLFERQSVPLVHLHNHLTHRSPEDHFLLTSNESLQKRLKTEELAVDRHALVAPHHVWNAALFVPILLKGTQVPLFAMPLCYVFLWLAIFHMLCYIYYFAFSILQRGSVQTHHILDLPLGLRFTHRTLHLHLHIAIPR